MAVPSVYGETQTADPQSFDRFARDYDRFVSLLPGQNTAWLLGLGLKGGRALDAGCGSGHAVEALADSFEEVLGLDLSSPLIRIAQAAHANRLEQGWNVPGAYLLLDRPDSEGRWGAYVGKATTPGLRHRVLQQLKDRDHWYRALLIRYEINDDETLNSSQAGWLEGRLYDHLANARRIDLHNHNRPRDCASGLRGG
ncbi:methyltransferase domain-containing protein [Nonomuraea sp. NPDC050536]|uniref:methyltransferase domain-containing protein n=1 Tax=Nonomuraea sp. NPDC050536 TaxID=3364366 RepID=UPI0037C652E2